MGSVVFRVVSSYLISSLIMNISSSCGSQGRVFEKKLPFISLWEISQHNLEIRDAIDIKIGKILPGTKVLPIILAK